MDLWEQIERTNIPLESQMRKIAWAEALFGYISKLMDTVIQEANHSQEEERKALHTALVKPDTPKAKWKS